MQDASTGYIPVSAASYFTVLISFCRIIMLFSTQFSDRSTSFIATIPDDSALPTYTPGQLRFNSRFENGVTNGRLFRASTSNFQETSSDDSFAGQSASGTSLDTSTADVPFVSAPGVRVDISDFIGNTTTNAYNIGNINNFSFNWSDSVSSSDVYDYYRFTVGNAASVNISLSGLSADADIRLFNTAGVQITSSTLSGNLSESINTFLGTGTYYLRVESFAGASTDYNLNISGAGPTIDPGSAPLSALDLGNLSRRSRSWNDFVGTTDTSDYYHFELSENGNFHLRLTGLSADADVQLLNRTGDLIASSTMDGTLPESIDRYLAAGDYYVRVYQYNGDTNYSLNLNTDIPAYSGTRTLTGTLRADTFDVTGNYTRTIISGDGNVDYGSGLRDTLDLSGLLSSSVNINLANTKTGGVLYNPGNGTRLFDSITLSDGREILFEGVDVIRFADRTIDLSITPNDPLYSQQWNLTMTEVQNAWRFTTGSSSVLVGIEDTGLGTTSDGTIHSDLRTTIFYPDNYQDDSLQTTAGATSHGTSVEGIIAAASNNGIGMTGINWNSSVFQIDVLGSNIGDQSLSQAAQNMINYANSQGQRLVINMSLGYAGSFGVNLDTAFEAVVRNNPNVLFVIAAGNSGQIGRSGISAPAYLANTYSNVMAVGAVWGTHDYYGNPTTPGTRIEYPGWWGSQYGPGLTLMAPSEVIATTATRSADGSVLFGFNTQFNGTSAATPNATGIASLVWSVNPNLSATQIRDIMSQTAYDMGAPGYDPYYGAGVANADAAVRRALAIARGALV
jgi:hypothetical protein